MTSFPVPVGIYRRLQQCSTLRNTFAILALDHRQNLRAALNPQSPSSVGDDEMVDFKRQVISTVAQQASALLVDPQYGIAQTIAAGDLAGYTSILASLEATGYTGDATQRQSRLLPGWSAEKALRAGANAAKLLVYYHPQAENAAETEKFVRQVAGDCDRWDLPLFLEPLSYSLDPQNKKLTPDEHHTVVIETAKRLVTPGVTVLKAEFPLDIQAHPDENEWAAACTVLSDACRVPWVLLSASVDYDTYLRQVEIACRNGASGVAAGRAVWKEATGLRGEERQKFLSKTASVRMQRLTGLCDALAKPWTEFYGAEKSPANWYEQY